MASRRTLKVASAIREVVSFAILADLRDPRVKDVTVTYVEVSGDLRQAKIHVSVMGEEKEQSLCLHGLQSSAGYLQQKISNRVDMRYTPRLTFVLDKGVKNAIEMDRILGELNLEKDADNLPSSEQDSESPTSTEPTAADESNN